MAAVSMPLTFQNSFWSQDYRRGLEVLYSQLEQGIAENGDIVAFIRARAAAETAIAVALAKPAAGTAFDVEDGASLQMTVSGLKEETKAQGKAHEAIAKDLEEKIAAPFEEWAEGYKERLLSSKANIVDGYLHAYEIANAEVARLKDVYLAKTRKADEAEDDARFAPVSQPVGDKYTSSPNLGPRDKRPQPRAPTRQPTMSERITARLKEFRLNASTTTSPLDTKPEVHFDADIEEKKQNGEGLVEPPKVDKGKGRAVEFEEPQVLASPPPMSPALPPATLNTDVPPVTTGAPYILSGVSFTPGQLSQVLTKAKSQLPLRAVRFPLLGEYQEAFTGEEFAAWLKDNVKQFDGDLDRAEEAATELTEKHNLLRRLGELGNDFEDADDAWYQIRPKAFNLDDSKPQETGSAALSPLAPLADNVSKRTGAFANLVSKALNSNTSTDPPHIRARKEADAADQEYRSAIRKLDRQRLGLEERIEDNLKTLQKWELDRLRAVKTVLTQYHNCISGGPKNIGASLEHSSTLIAAYHPEADLKALIEQYRTGPFRPTAHVYESVAHDEADVVFGIDLRKWADLGLWSPSGSPEQKDVLPPVLVVLLKGLKDAYPKLANDAERRKTWVYEVPLPAVHHLRETLNSIPPEKDIPEDVITKYDAPVLASTIKLWALELDPPLCLYEGWEEFRKLYPTVGAVKPEQQPSEEKHIHELQNALQKLPRIHLFVLDAIVKHLKELIIETVEGDEPNDTYIAKLALSVGRTILRPRVETKFSIQDRHATLLFIDLLKKYDQILPPTIAKKKRESERKVPVRRRTRPVDMRMSRSRISAGADLKELQAAQMAHRGLRSPPPVPPIPTNLSAVPETKITPPTPATAEVPAGKVPVVTAEPEALHDEPEDISLQDNRSPEPAPAPAPVPAPVAEPIPTPPAPVVAPAVPSPPPVNYASIPPPPPLATIRSGEVPPVFKEPPPEVDDDLPPRPSFKEPPPEHEDGDLPMPNFPDRAASPPLPMPNFVDPPAEPLTPPASSPPATFNSRPGTPKSAKSTSPPPRKVLSRAGSISSRSSSPNKAEAQAAAGVGAGAPTRVGGVRGPRGVGGTGSVGNMVKNFNRTSASFANGTNLGRTGSPPSGSGTIGSRRGSVAGGMTHAKRSSASRSSLFERRTMASDAEEEVVQ